MRRKSNPRKPKLSPRLRSTIRLFSSLTSTCRATNSSRRRFSTAGSSQSCRRCASIKITSRVAERSLTSPPSQIRTGRSRVIRLLPPSLRPHALFPQDKQLGVPARDAPQPVHRRTLSAFEPLELPSRPASEGLIEVAKHLNALRAIEPPVVVQPASHHRVGEARQVLQALVIPGGRHPPIADGLADLLGGLGADRRQEINEKLSPPVLRSPRLEGVTEEIERDILVHSSAVIILAVDDLGLRCMKLKPALCKACPDDIEHKPRLLLTPAVDNRIVSVPLERDARKGSLHPRVKRIMQEEIRQERTCHTPLWGAFRPLKEGAVLTLDRGTKPPADIQLHPGKIRVVRYGSFDQIVWNGIKKGLDIQIYDPIKLPASLTRYTHRIECGSAGSISVGVGMEDRLHLRLQHHLCHRLRHAIGYGWNTEWPRAASVLLYLDKPHGRRDVRARRHPVPDLVQVTL